MTDGQLPELPTTFHSIDHGWLYCEPTDEMVEFAKALRADRDTKFKDIYPKADSDLKWLGELGELCMIAWLRSLSIPGMWHRGNPVGRPDITMADVPIGVKVVKRTVPMRPDYTAQISARHSEEAVDWFFFMCFEVKTNRMVFLGGIRPADFLKTAKFYRDGDWVHSKYQVRGHDIYNGPVNGLISPMEWLKAACPTSG